MLYFFSYGTPREFVRKALLFSRLPHNLCISALGREFFFFKHMNTIVKSHQMVKIKQNC